MTATATFEINEGTATVSVFCGECTEIYSHDIWAGHNPFTNPTPGFTATLEQAEAIAEQHTRVYHRLGQADRAEAAAKLAALMVAAFLPAMADKAAARESRWERRAASALRNARVTSKPGQITVHLPRWQNTPYVAWIFDHLAEWTAHTPLERAAVSGRIDGPDEALTFSW